MKPRSGRMNLLTSLVFLSIFFPAIARAQVVINEVMASNSSTIQDPNGSYADWIELYNTSATPVNLQGYLIFDSGGFWTFPSALIPGNGYLIVWANDKNNPATLETSFKLDAAGEHLILRNPGFQTIDEVVVPQASPDESYGRFPNGTGEFVRMSSPTPSAQNTNSSIPLNPDAHYIVINEVVLSNTSGITDEDGETSDWFELYNSGPVIVNLKGLRLADSGKQWILPDINMLPGSYLIVFASDKNRQAPELHTNFKLSSTGEILQFMNTDGSVLDSVDIPQIAPDHGYARIPNGIGNFKDLPSSTPGAQNQDISVEPNPNAGLLKINEVVSNNVSGLRDFQNEFNDWIEIYNSGPIPIDLEGLKLADSERVWAFPTTNLQPGGYLVVFASGKNITTGGELHTNFNISSTDGETLLFLNRDDSVIEVLDVVPLAADVSYGRDPNGTGPFRIYNTPTPGAANQDIVIQPNPDASNIVINEIMTNNSSTFPDEDQSFEDWIEFFNKSANVTVNLEGLKLQDATGTWVFPAVSMPPQSYLMVFASDKNRLGPQLHTNFKLSSSGDSLTFLNKDNSVLSSVEIPVLEPDTTYGRLPNGMGTFQTITTPTPNAVNQQINVQPNPDAGLLTINEVSSNNEALLDEDGEANDWIEIFNTGTKSVNLEGLRLRDSGDVWTFPNFTLGPSEYLLVFASNKNKTGTQFHTNFKLDSSGETLQLLNKNDSIVESIDIPELPLNQSFARIPNGTGDRQIVSSTTPGAFNSLAVNHPPVLNPIENKNVNEGASLNFGVSATDPDSNPVTITATGLQAWMSFDGTNFSANPGFSNSGNYNVTFTASDGSLTDSETIAIAVANVNRVPVLATIGNKNVNEGAVLNFAVTASDPDSDPVTITVTGLTAWMSFDGANFSASPVFGNAGNFDLTFTASDGSLSDSETITVSIGAVNQPPVLNSIGNKSVDEGGTLNFAVTASDPDSDPVTITVTGLTAWMSFDGANFSASPVSGDAGNFDLTFTASDGSLSDSETITVSVGAVNQPPVLNAIGNKNVDEGGTLNFAVTASDPDSDLVTITVTGLTAWMSFDGADFSASPLFGNAGNFDLTFTASDGSLSDSETITVSVEVVQPQAAQITSPADGSSLTETSFLIEWNPGVMVDEYYLDISAKLANLDARGGGDLHSQNHGTDHSAIVSGITLNGSPVYATLWSLINGVWEKAQTITYQTDEVGQPAEITSPENGSTLASGDVTIMWDGGVNVEEYYLDVSSDQSLLEIRGAGDLYSANKGTETSAGVTGLPLNGNDIYAAVWSLISGNWQRSSVTTYSTNGGFSIHVDPFPYYQSFTPVIPTDPAPNFSGAAAAKMILTYLWWNSLDHPNGPPDLTDPQLSDQTQLMNFGLSENYSPNRGGSFLDARGLWKTIQELDPPYIPYNYNWGILTRSSAGQTMGDIAKWLAYEAGGGSANQAGLGVDGHPVHVPGAVALYGDYNHWVVTRGVRTTDNPWQNHQFGIHGFWINDPNPSGLGENTFVTAEQFEQMYLLPLTNINPKDPNYNQFVSVLEPPVGGGEATVVRSKPRLDRRIPSFFELQSFTLENGEEAFAYVRDNLDEDAFPLIQAAVDGIRENLIPYDETFAGLIKNTVARKPLFVKSSGGNYYLVPFELPLIEKTEQGDTAAGSGPDTKTFQIVEGGAATVVAQSEGDVNIPHADRNMRNLWKQRTVTIAIIDAETGKFNEVTWSKDPVKYLPVSKKGAFRLLAKSMIEGALADDEELDASAFRQKRRELSAEIMNGAEIELIHIDGNSLYYPSWKISYNGIDYLVDQEGKVSEK